MKITIDLPVTSYLQKYLTYRFGQLYQARESDWFGLLIINILSPKNEADYELKNFKPNSYYTITLGISKAEKRGFLVSKRKGEQLAKAVENYFRNELYLSAIMNARHFDIDYKTTIINTLESYGITEEELHYESIRKDFNRNKKSIEDNLDQII